MSARSHYTTEQWESLLASQNKRLGEMAKANAKQAREISNLKALIENRRQLDEEIVAVTVDNIRLKVERDRLKAELNCEQRALDDLENKHAELCIEAHALREESDERAALRHQVDTLLFTLHIHRQCRDNLKAANTTMRQQIARVVAEANAWLNDASFEVEDLVRMIAKLEVPL